MATCPKCGAKLKKTDWRPNCWKCGVNIVYYGMEGRLEADAQRAEKEFNRFYHMTAGIKTSFIGSPLAYVRWILTLLCIGALFLPLVKISVTLPYHMVEGASYGLLQTVMFVKDLDLGGIIAAFSAPVIGGTLLKLFLSAAFLAVGAVMAVLNLILILRAYTKSGGILLAVRWGDRAGLSDRRDGAVPSGGSAGGAGGHPERAACVWGLCGAGVVRGRIRAAGGDSLAGRNPDAADEAGAGGGGEKCRGAGKREGKSRGRRRNGIDCVAI